jgi:tetratricopeptide (TPR) repeat protein
MLMESTPRNYPPVLDRRLRRLLGLVLLLFALLAVNSVYLSTITLLENTQGTSLQDGFYLSMFLLHLGLGLLLVPPFLLFAILHQRRARRRPNRYAIRAGMGLFGTGLALLLSGLVLTRFGWFEINDPQWRSLAYWLHVLSPLAVGWLFLVHRLAGPPLHWRSGAYWGGAALLGTALTLAVPLLQRERAVPDPALPYAPALARVAGGETRIPARHLMQDGVCAECHGDIAQRAAMGMHRFSSFNNPAYRFSIDEAREALLARDGTVEGTRLCAVCHDQVPLFSGRFDDPAYDPDADPGAQAGIGCLGCHAITAIESPRGNGAYTLQDPPRYPFAFSDNALLRALNRQLIKAKPAFHKATFLKPLHRSAEFCSLCHKVHLPYELNHYKWLRGQNHYDSFLLSGVSGHRVDSFYYPERAAPNCAHCHMPLLRSEDPAARDFAQKGERSVHDHLFGAANTGVAHLLDLPEWSQQVRYRFLQSLARVDIFGLRQAADIDGELLAPLRPQTPALQPGRRYLLELVVRTLGVGHQLTQGTTDSNELWLDVSIRDDRRVIGRSGALDQNGAVDPWAYFVNSYLLDRHGERIERRNAQDIFVALYDHQIPPGAAATVHYGLAIPADVQGPIRIEAKLNYRKFDTRFLRHVQGVDFTGNDLPIVTLAQDRLILPVQGSTDEIPDQAQDIPEWQRWNDYGIGLLLKGKHELRQAEQAFRRVERLQPAQGALNLARVHFREGRLADTGADLQRATAADAPPWTLAWYAALVAQEYGELDRAIGNLQQLVQTRFPRAVERGFDFSKDYRVLNELGRSLYERARRERGEGRQTQRAAYLNQAREWLHKALAIDPENLSAHYNLALVYTELGDAETAAEHRRLHEKYRPDDQAIERAVSAHRRANPAADHAAEATAIYALEPPVSTKRRTAFDDH